jgi:steroid delta-isomerase-like uncharacterized protein
MIVPKVVQDYFDAWNHRDAPGIVACFASRGTYSDPIAGHMLGNEAIVGYASRLWAAFRGLHFMVGRITFAADGILAAEWRMRCTHAGSSRGLPPTGSAMDLPGVTIIEIEGDKLASVAGYFDSRALFRQLGLPFDGQHFGPVIQDTGTHLRLEPAAGVPYVPDLIRGSGMFADIPPLDVEDCLWPIRLMTLGHFEVNFYYEPLVFCRKAPKKPIALLKAIVALGGRDVPEGQLTDALWPDEEADAAHDAFAVNVHRLRRLIGHDAVIRRDGRVALDADRCWIDVWAFERLLDQARAAGTADERVVLTVKALALYRGAFLPADPDEPWALSMRERLRAKFIRAAAFIGRHLADAGEWQEAADYYLRGIEVDNLAEEFYQGAMRCYAHLNRPAEGLALYHRLQRTLSIVLGVAPSPASQALYHRLRREAPHPVFR